MRQRIGHFLQGPRVPERGHRVDGVDPSICGFVTAAPKPRCSKAGRVSTFWLIYGLFMINLYYMVYIWFIILHNAYMVHMVFIWLLLVKNCD